MPFMDTYYGGIKPEKGVFVVPAGSLAFSVGLFTGLAFVCIATLAARRVMFGGELGGKGAAKIASSVFLVVLWLIYLVASIVQSLGSK